MIEIQAPNSYNIPSSDYTIFLAGSIEMGIADSWQKRIISEFERDSVIFLNPRRDDWDSSWVQSIDNQQFKHQVSWELGGLESSDLIIFYFDPNTKSPITLLELGLCVGLGNNIVVYCPDGFWRKGNVDVVCERYQIPIVNSEQELIDAIKQMIVT